MTTTTCTKFEETRLYAEAKAHSKAALMLLKADRAQVLEDGLSEEEYVDGLEEWVKDDSDLACYLAENGVELPAKAPTPTVQVAQPTVQATAPVTKTVQPEPMTAQRIAELHLYRKELLHKLYRDQHGYSAPKSWKKDQLVLGIQGKMPVPRSAAVKVELQAKVAEKFGFCPTSYSGPKCASALAGLHTPRASSTAKAEMVAKVVAKAGHCPQSWTATDCQAYLEGRKVMRPAGFAIAKRPDGLTAIACKALLKEARDGGKEVPAYSKLKADELRALVAQLGLTK